MLDALHNLSKSDLIPKAVPTIDFAKGGINVANATKTGYLFCPRGGVFDMSYPNSKLRRGRVQGDGMICPTLTCNPENIWVIDVLDKGDYDSERRKVRLRLRRLTERECFRLMGLKDVEIDSLVDSGQIPLSGMYKLAGNSIIVDVLENIFKSLFIEDSDVQSRSSDSGSLTSNALF